MTPPIRHISVIAPMRNEADHIEALIADIAAQDFDGQVDVLIADGCSTDDSVARARRAATSRCVALTILRNDQMLPPHGLNQCIRHATGDLIVRLDCHSRYPGDYLRRCALASEETGAEVVGGVLVPRGRTVHERAVACAMDSPFGGIQWARGTSSNVRRESDTALYGAFRPRTFDLAGVFDESLVRNEDDEFTLRLRRLGGRVVIDSTIRVYYVPRGTFRGVFRQYFEYGLWKPPIMLRYRQVMTLRSLAPIVFVGSVAMLGALAPRSRAARSLLLAECGAYCVGAVSSGAVALRKQRQPLSLLPRVAAVFPTFHVAYGLGMLTGVARAVGRPSASYGPAVDRESTAGP